MNLIQQRQVQDLTADISQLKADALSSSNSNFDLLNSNQTFGGDKTFADDIYSQRIQIRTSGMSYRFSLSGSAFIAQGEKFHYGGSELYTYAPNANELYINSTSAGTKGEIIMTANSGLSLNVPQIDLSTNSPTIILDEDPLAFQLYVPDGADSYAPLTVDTSASSDPQIGINKAAPTYTLDIVGTQYIDANNTSSAPLTLANTDSNNNNLIFSDEAGSSSLGTHENTTPANSGFYLRAADILPLYLGHATAQAIRIDVTGYAPRVRIGDQFAEGGALRPAEAAGSILEIQNTGYGAGPLVTLYNDQPAPLAGSHSAIRFVEKNSLEIASWAAGHHDDPGGGDDGRSSFRIAYSGAQDAIVGENDYLIINNSGSVQIQGTGITRVSPTDSTLVGGGNLSVAGNIALTTGLVFDYDNMPSSDPEIKGVVYRDSNTLKISNG